MARYKRFERAKSSEQFLELLAYVRFVAGFRHKLVDAKWPDIKRSLHDFNLTKLAASTDVDIDTMLQHHNIIRNRRKYEDVVNNARLILQLSKEHGDVTEWITLHKTRWEQDPLFSPSLEEVFQRFHGIGKTTAQLLQTIYLKKKGHVDFVVRGT